MLDKEKCFKSVVYAPKYNKINLVVPQKTREIIFDTAWNMFHRYSYDEAVGYLDVMLYDQANEYNLQCTYDKLIDMYLKLHHKKNFLINERNSFIMNQFIEVRYFPRHLLRESNKIYVDSNSPQLATTKAHIRLDAFLELDELEKYTVFINYRESDGPVQQFKASHCYLNRTVGLGINGVCTDIYLDEESYYKVMAALGIEHIKPNF